MHGTQLFEKATNIAIESPSTWKSVTFLSKPTVKPPQGAVPSASSLKPSRETLAFLPLSLVKPIFELGGLTGWRIVQEKVRRALGDNGSKTEKSR